MAFKVKKEEAARLTALAIQLEAKAERVRQAIVTFNSEKVRLFEFVTDAVNAYNALVEVTQGLVGDLGSEFDSEFDDKSETWQDGDRGSIVREWIDTYVDAELETLEVDEPEDLETPDMEHAEVLNNLTPAPEL